MDPNTELHKSQQQINQSQGRLNADMLMICGRLTELVVKQSKAITRLWCVVGFLAGFTIVELWT